MRQGPRRISRSNRRERFIRWGSVVALALAGAHSAGAQVVETTPEVAATVTVTAQSDTEWSVVEDFHFAPRSGAPLDTSAFLFLARPCTAMLEPAMVIGSELVPLAVEPRGPWRRLSEPTRTVAERGGAQRFSVRYRVKVDARAFDLPLIVPTYPLPKNADGRNGVVRVTVTLPDSLGVVSFPRFTRHADGRRYEGRFPALPSTLRIRLTREASPCDERVPAGDDGGLTWRFWLLVAILGVWVPTYQWWARRQPDGER